MLEGERLIRADLAVTRYSPSRGALGRLYLTNLRLIWSPYRFMFWIFRGKPTIISLSEIEECKLGEPDFFLGFPADLYTGEATYRFFVYTWHGLWMRATRAAAMRWVAAMETAAAAAKQVAAERG
jgi:hypothetical protein